jgi:hypothetical protein
MLNRSLGIAAISLIISPLSHAGSIIEFETRQLQSSPPIIGSVKISAQGSMTRMDVISPESGGSATMIFNGTTEELMILEPGEMKYFVMTRAQMDAMAVQMSDAMQQMEAALAAMPPEQREMAEKMMQGRMPAAQPAKPASTVAKSGGSDTVAGYDCENYSVSSGGRKIRDMCVTEWDEIDGGREVADALMKFADFFANMREAFSGMGGMADVSQQQDMFEHLQALGGYPVLSREYDEAGVLISESRVTSARQENVDDSVFLPPTGYQKQEMP